MRNVPDSSNEQTGFWKWYHDSGLVRALLGMSPWFMRTFPRRFSHLVRYPFAFFYYLFGCRFRRAVRGNLAVALGGHASPRDVRRLTWRVFSNVTKTFADMFYVASLPRERIAELIAPQVGVEHIHTALKEKKGAIFLTGHVGNWELGGMTLGKFDVNINMVYMPDQTKAFEQQRLLVRADQNVSSIPMGGGFEVSLMVIRKLNAGEIIALKGDRVLRGVGMTVRLFGRDTLFPRGPYLLSYVSGAPILPTFMVLAEDNRYQPIVCEPIFPVRTGDRGRDVLILAQKMARVMEEYIRRYPDQWYMFYPFWKNAGDPADTGSSAGADKES